MEEPNLVIKRLKERKNQSTGMLTGWSHDLLARQSTPGAGLTNVPFRTPFRLLTQKSNSQDEQKTDLVHHDSFSGFARMVTQKFEDAKELIPLAPRVSREMKTWGEMERVFPSVSPVGSRHEEPLQPGEMRSGTVIQKFDTFPKPGQSVESFKAQSGQATNRQRSKEIAPQKRTPTPGQRLFSRVTEMTQNKPLESQPAVGEEADEPEKVLKPIEQSEPKPVLPEMLRPEVEPEPHETEAEVEEKATSGPEPKNVSETAPQNLPDLKPQKPSETPVEMPLHQIQGREEPVKPEKKEAKKEESRGATPVAVPAVPKALPASKPVGEQLPRALPVKKEPAHQETVHKAIPVATRRESVSLPQRQSPMTSRVVQRSIDQNDSLQPEALQPAIKNISAPPSHVTTTLPPVVQQLQPVQPTTEQETPSGLSDVDMPLRKVVQQRKQSTTRLVHSTTPAPIKPTAPLPLVQRSQQPLLSPQKYSMEMDIDGFIGQEEEAPRSAVSALPLTFDHVRSSSVSAPQRMPLFQSMPAQAMEQQQTPSVMQNDLPFIPPAQMQLLPTTPEAVESIYEKKRTQLQASKSEQRGASNAGAAAQNVVQRAMVSAEEPPVAEAPSADLDKLADDLFPYVKRLLEIERERTRGSLR